MHAMATGTLADLERLIDPTAVNREAVDEPPAASTPGPAGFWATAQWLRTAFSDLTFEVHEIVEDGDLVVVHNTMSGRHAGDFVSWDHGQIKVVMPPTGREFASTQTHWLRFRDGLLDRALGQPGRLRHRRAARLGASQPGVPVPAGPGDPSRPPPAGSRAGRSAAARGPGIIRACARLEAGRSTSLHSHLGVWNT